MFTDQYLIAAIQKKMSGRSQSRDIYDQNLIMDWSFFYAGGGGHRGENGSVNKILDEEKFGYEWVK